MKIYFLSNCFTSSNTKPFVHKCSPSITSNLLFSMLILTSNKRFNYVVLQLLLWIMWGDSSSTNWINRCNTLKSSNHWRINHAPQRKPNISSAVVLEWAPWGWPSHLQAQGGAPYHFLDMKSIVQLVESFYYGRETDLPCSLLVPPTLVVNATCLPWVIWCKLLPALSKQRRCNAPSASFLNTWWSH